jgi:hypothetical protein
MDEVLVEDLDVCCRILDTFGLQCSVSDEVCEEFRTVGVEMMTREDNGDIAICLFPLCERHLTRFLQETIFGRRLDGFLGSDGTIKEVMDQEDPTP